MFQYTISEQSRKKFKSSLEILNDKFSYTPIWFYSIDGVISKMKEEGSIPAPTTFQINDLYEAYVKLYEPFGLNYFLQYVSVTAFQYPGIHMYEAFVIGLANMIILSDIYLTEKEPSPKEDPFTN